MPEAARVVTTDAEIDLAIKHAKQYEKFDRKVMKVGFSKTADQLRLVLNDGVICTIPRRLIQGLAGARKKDLKPIQILGGGTGLLWPILDVSHSVPALLTGVYGSARWVKELSTRLGPRKAVQMSPPLQTVIHIHPGPDAALLASIAAVAISLGASGKRAATLSLARCGKPTGKTSLAVGATTPSSRLSVKKRICR